MRVSIGYYLASIVPGPILLARSELAAVVISHLAVFPDGIEIPMSVYARDPDVFHRENEDRPADRRLTLRTGAWRLRPLDQYGIDLNIELPDGSQLATDRPYIPTPGPSKPPHAIATTGVDFLHGSGNGGHQKFDWFLWPLPTEGTIRISVEWSEQEIPTTSTTLDVSTLVDAAARASTIWTEDAGLPSHFGRA